MIMWMLGIELKTSLREASARNCLSLLSSSRTIASCEITSCHKLFPSCDPQTPGNREMVLQ